MLLYFLTREDSLLQDAVKIDGQCWKLTTREVSVVNETFEDFICISYAWGSTKEANPFQTSWTISTRTIPALSTAAKQRPSCKLFWIDAFCVPHTPSEREKTLESMGFIYAAAAEVIAVLSSQTQPAIECLATQDHICFQQLAALESDPWVSRAWTYQEAANAKLLSFTCDGSHRAPVGAMDCLNCLGYTMELLAGQGPSIDMVVPYPRLTLLEDLLAEYCMGGYQAHSALTIMSNMELRNQERSEDHFYAMIGVLSEEPASSQDIQNPCELFMSLCERKGDYSFIYAVSKREEIPSRRWRPLPENLHAILTNHSWGSRQSAHQENGSLYLEFMMVPKITEMLSEDIIFRKRANSLVHGNDTDSSSASLVQKIHQGLLTMGFRGSAKPVYTEKGFFFPIEDVSDCDLITVMVSTEIRWSFGAPGLVRYVATGIDKYTSGVYIGAVDEVGSSTVKMC